MWEINSGGQLISFLYALVLGMFFSLIYDALKSYRLILKSANMVVFFQDIFYFIFLSVITFIFFLIFTNGEIRIFILFGIILGFFVWRITFSKFFVPFFKYIISFINRIFGFIRDKIIDFLGILSKIGGYTLKKLKNIKNTLKKLLKTAKGLLYTNHE